MPLHQYAESRQKALSPPHSFNHISLKCHGKEIEILMGNKCNLKCQIKVTHRNNNETKPEKQQLDSVLHQIKRFKRHRMWALLYLI